MRRLIMILLLTAPFIGCGDDDAVPADLPDDFFVEYSWFEGSVAPPYHYSYDIEVHRDGSGTIRFRPDYGDSTEWAESFSVSEEDLDRLYALMIDQQILGRSWEEDPEPPVGGPVARMDVVAGGVTTEVPADPLGPASRLEPVYEAMDDLVPQALWDDLEARRQTFMDEYGF
jgi:hypothetical protein